jgi:hypothetical protein
MDRHQQALDRGVISASRFRHKRQRLWLINFRQFVDLVRERQLSGADQ